MNANNEHDEATDGAGPGSAADTGPVSNRPEPSDAKSGAQSQRDAPDRIPEGSDVPSDNSETPDTNNASELVEGSRPDPKRAGK